MEFNNADFEWFDKNNALFKNFHCDRNIMRFTCLGWGTQPDGIQIRGIEGCIRASTTSIGPRNMQNGFHVVFHEMGHSIDATNAEWKKDIYSQQSSFQRVMMNDIKNLQGKLKIGKITEDDLNKLREDGNSRGVQDILGACRYIDDGAYKQIGEILYTYGHSGAYWQRSDPKAEAASELFANISAAQVSPAEMEYINKFFPQSKREFDKIIEKVAKQYTE